MTSFFLGNALLITFRLLPLLVVAPITVFRRLPTLTRVVLTLSLALVLASGITADNTPTTITWASLTLEFIFGASLAFGFHAAIGAISTFGHVLDQQIGIAAAAVFDPGTEQTSSLIGEALTLAALVGFLALDGHHAVLRGFALLLDSVPPGTANLPGEELLKILGVQFGLAFLLVAPILVAIWLVDFALALISRAAPQANIYFVAIPIKLAIGLLALAWLSTNLLPSLHRIFDAVLSTWPTTGAL